MRIVILGSGNIATHIGKAFHTCGHDMVQVYSRNKTHAHALASVLAADVVAIEDVIDDADLYVIAVADAAIEQVVSQLSETLAGTVVHCSGATHMNMLDKFRHYGVIYPLQSLRKDVDTCLENIPFAVEANTESETNRLLELMQPLSPLSFLCNSEQRLALHVAAVFVNNFSNILFQIAYDILQGQQLSFDLLKPIILETAQKVQNQLPFEVQTGPAQRGDIQTIQTHLQFLTKSPHWLKIYQQLTEEITRNKHEYPKR